MNDIFDPINDTDMKRVRRAEIASRFAALGLFKVRCEKCEGFGYIADVPCSRCERTGHLWEPKGQIDISSLCAVNQETIE